MASHYCSCFSVCLLFVPGRVLLCGKHLGTVRALVWPEVPVHDGLVPPAVVRAGESLVAGRAPERLLSRVCPLVLGQVGGAGCAVRAEPALQGRRAGVGLVATASGGQSQVRPVAVVALVPPGRARGGPGGRHAFAGRFVSIAAVMA